MLQVIRLLPGGGVLPRELGAAALHAGYAELVAVEQPGEALAAALGQGLFGEEDVERDAEDGEEGESRRPSGLRKTMS